MWTSTFMGNAPEFFPLHSPANRPNVTELQEFAPLTAPPRSV